jgi:hypothetical protein
VPVEHAGATVDSTARISSRSPDARRGHAARDEHLVPHAGSDRGSLDLPRRGGYEVGYIWDGVVVDPGRPLGAIVGHGADEHRDMHDVLGLGGCR